MLRIDIKSDLARHLGSVAKIPAAVVKDTYNYFVKVTPVRTGNARRSTHLNGNSIDLMYPYADKLEAGGSQQAPEGMSTLAEEYLTKRMQQEIAKNKG